MSEPEPHPKQHRPKQGSLDSSSLLASGHSQGQNKIKKAKKQTKLRVPVKAETALLPNFQGLPLDQIHLPETRSECQRAVAEILTAGLSGFDTEAKPTFKKGQKSDGPHLVQFALTNKAFLFQLHHSECQKAAADLITSQQVLKVGFGLKNDHGQIQRRFGVSLNHVLDLDQTFGKLGYGRNIGVRGAIGVLLKQSFKKSKSTTTSNWAQHRLTARQLTYAANDSYAALKVMEALQSEGLLK
ncbi:MAG: 3'-5' exonuclease [Akkermansiaceae bacterium]